MAKRIPNFIRRPSAQHLPWQMLNDYFPLFVFALFLLSSSACNRPGKQVDRRSSEEAATNLRLEKAKFKISNLPKFLVSPGEELTVEGENLTALTSTKPKIEALSTASGNASLVGGTYEADLIVASAREARLRLPDSLPWGPYSIKFESESTTRQLVIFSNQGNGDFSIYSAGSDAVCSGQKFVDATGTIRSGTKSCMATLADCAADGATGCIATTSYAAASIDGLPGKVLSGVTVAGVGGNITLPAADKVSTAAGTYGVNGASVTPSLGACSSDGATGCLASSDYPAAMAAGLATKVLDGQTVAGIGGGVILPSTTRVLTGTTFGVGGNGSSGQLTLPAAGKVYDGTSFGIFGATTTGTLTLPDAANVVLGSSAFGDPGAQITPAFNTNFPTPLVRPASPVITATTFSVASGQITLGWSAVTGATGYVVVMSTAATITFHPGDGITYSNGAQGADNIVYVGSANTATFNATINASTVYKFAVYAYEASKVYSDNPGTKTMYGCGALANGKWIPVPGNAVYGTSDFCVMKYTASELNNVATSQDSLLPWVNITRSNAKNACLNLGAGYHLVTNAEWMTIALNIAGQDLNWTGQAKGNGALIKGHSDGSPGTICEADSDSSKAWVENDCTRQLQGSLGLEQRRTFSLSNEENIWDFSGNAWQWVDLPTVTNKPSPMNNSWLEFSSLTGFGELTKSMFVPISSNAGQGWWDDSWGSDRGVGWYVGAPSGSGGALRRGGNSGAYASRSGIFAANLSAASEFADGFTTFRCAWSP